MTLGREAAQGLSCGHAFYLESPWNHNNNTWYLLNIFTVCQMLSQVLSSLILTTAPWKRYHWPDSFSYSEEKNEMLERCCVRTQILSQEAWGSVWCSRKAKTSFSQRKAKWIHFSSSPHGWHYGPRVVIIHLHSFRSALRWPPAILPHPACITSWTFHIIYQIMSPPTWNPQWLPSCCM